MKNIRTIISGVIIAFFGGFIALYIYTRFLDNPQVVEVKESSSEMPVQLASMPAAGELPDLTYAAEKSVHAVVHITTEIETQRQQYGNDIMEFFFGDRYRYQQPQQPRMQRATGSGVIISKDGYVVTNNHVIKGADRIKVVMNNGESFEAEMVGTDPGSDIALLKLDAKKDLPYLSYGNSDNLKIGEWVLAVGNPFNLTSTVTAGIVSAKSRNIGIIRQGQDGRLPIESFIQTDAAVNPGNSGGALVNMRGELIGINTAIASRTGSYTGYSFAIPVSIFSKIVADLKEFGVVQQALVGIIMGEVNSELVEEEGLDKIEGVYVADVAEDGGAAKAGIEKGDVVLSINGFKTNSMTQLREQVSKYRPGDKVKVLVKRDNKKKHFDVVLRNSQGETGVVKVTAEVLGAKIANLKAKERYNLGLRYGVKILELNRGQFKDAGVRKGFIITHVNKRPIRSKNDVMSIIKKAEGNILVEGYYPNGEPAYYVFSIDN
ncbi:Do family serine endopeptidase [Prolixibacteraceae bacterium JC049]|nr:Do family serine endopeptidase [Prolixibacteraceae bacterium JC049]